MSLTADQHTVLVYSDDPAVREQVRLAVGPRPASDVPLRYVDAASQEEVLLAVDGGGVDLCVLDGEAWPTGGMGVCRQLKVEVRDCPPCVVITGRHDDHWLARWSQADSVLTHPLDAFDAAAAVAALLRQRSGRRPSAGAAS
jgi:DNA-binding response OmpR family regulator